MRWLELKVPPPIVGGLLAALALLLSRRLPGLALSLPDVVRLGVTGLLGTIGLLLDAVALLGFRTARTTMNPMRPENSTALVERGVYRFTRNPMYLGLLLILAGWCTWLGNAVAFSVLPMFLAYITRFQILPEERMLASRFGRGYIDYQARVRRWI